MSPPRNWIERVRRRMEARRGQPLVGAEAFKDRIGAVGPMGFARAILVNSHRRSGTHLLIDTIRAHFPVEDDWHHLEDDFYAALAREPVLIKDHEWRRADKLAAPSLWHSYMHWAAAGSCYAAGRQLYIVRDPRATLRSQYYFDVMGIEADFKLDEAVDFAAYLRRPSARDPSGRLNQIGYWCRHVANWVGQPDVLVLRYEDVIDDLPAVLARLSAFLELQPLARPRAVEPSGVGTEATPLGSRKLPAPWTQAEEALLLAEAAAAGLPALGYGWPTGAAQG